MKHIKTFNSMEYIPDKIDRTAVRAVIFKKDMLLMIKIGDRTEYKFPGGGVKAKETYESALIRETLEETGMKIASITNCLGYIDQIYPDKFDFAKPYYMRSIYYLVKINEFQSELNLDEYEKKLDFKPFWISLEEALKENSKARINSIFHWTNREYFMLKYLKNDYKKHSNY